MKVIFLDIDGVLNHQHTKDRIGGYIGFNPGHIKRFNKIVEAHPDVKIVISSTWRCSFTSGVYEDFAGLVRLLKERGLQGDIVDHTPVKMTYLSRGAEIRMWLDDHPEVKNYILIDDDTEGMKPATGTAYDPETDNHYSVPAEVDLRPRWVQTSWENGLKEAHVARAIKLLEGP